MAGTSLTFVTITYRAEDALLRLQARSLARFADPAIVEKIIVIDNGRPALHGRRLERLLAEYGPLRDRVQLITAADVADTRTASSGWVGQQVLKLAIARHVTTPWYVLLDAKNHAVRPLRRDDFVAPDGRARGGFHSYADHPLKTRLLTTLRYLGLPDTAADWYPPTSTPFVMHTRTALDIVEGLGADFADVFAREGLSEFFLYSGWILRRDGDWDAVYDGVAIQCPTLWGGASSAAGIQRALTQIEATDAPFFGVHRRALRRLSRSDFGLIADYWREVGLMPTGSAARRFRRGFQFQHAVAALRDRLPRPGTHSGATTRKPNGLAA